MDLYDCIKQAQNEAFLQHLNANTVILNRNLRLVKQAYSVFHGTATCYPPMIRGMASMLTDELPEDTAFLLFESPNISTSREAKIRQETRAELINELKSMTLTEVMQLIESG